MTANSVLACRALNKGEDSEKRRGFRHRDDDDNGDDSNTELEVTQMEGGLNSPGCAALPSPRDFGHFASLLWLEIKKK